MAFTSPIYHIKLHPLVIHRFSTIRCLSPSSSSIRYELVDPISVPFHIDESTGQIVAKVTCPKTNIFLIKCSTNSPSNQTAYAKIIVDRMCEEIESTNWINRIGEERRKRNHLHQSQTHLVSEKLFQLLNRAKKRLTKIFLHR